MEIKSEKQLNPISDEVLSKTSIIQPILKGLLYSLKQDVVSEVGGYDAVKIKMLPRLYRPGDGDVGICFEYAIHEALNNGSGSMQERISDVLKLCKIKNGSPRSILFGIEKTGSIQLINTADNILTSDSRALTGLMGQPPKLKPRLNLLAAAFRRPSTRPALPSSIRGLWKADLFVGSEATQQWIGATVKINPSQLEGAAGLRVGIIPTRQGQSDKVRKDEKRNLIICPVHHDADFMQMFYESWRCIQAFIFADAKVPKEVSLPSPVDREICRLLEERREFPVIEVIEAIKPFGQPELLSTESQSVPVETVRGEIETQLIIAPISN
ncbi:hypothetical protein CFR79_12515 [Komagataeibacter saccharivorans]|uniref:hypothetical protein n=1 Tax=Komagataeibacter saccharivorans TaxID=265959 RepID=UPI000D7CB5C6|nr:hypothetical protein [Komagataeibacter saccharivorans]PYD49871.1 hypothetical protein CFR79_12515 [Komagataeibacter saccharivorans]GBQ37417.1 hypothetical protein AA0614_1016 [Komagataeibacter saccharivorans NRIC 0614]